MDMTVQLYLGLLVAVALLRLAELQISRRNQRRLQAGGATKMPEPQFRWMVLFHVGVLVATGSEVLLLHRPLHALLAIAMGTVFTLATGLRWWVIHVLSDHWNVQVMTSASLGVVAEGPYRWIRHPNYAAVYVELMALPLIHSAWITALVGAVIQWKILQERIRLEESVLMSNPKYLQVMGSKPRFLPNIFRLDSDRPSERLRGDG